jgi:hypothetical protein
MTSRAWMLLAVALVSPAWSQSFDLHSPALQKIVHDTAATQFAPARLIEAAPPKQKPAPLESMTFASPKTPALVHNTPVLRAPAPAPHRDGIVSGLLDAILRPDDDLDFEVKHSAKSFCRASNADKPSVQRDEVCGR